MERTNEDVVVDKIIGELNDVVFVPDIPIRKILRDRVGINLRKKPKVKEIMNSSVFKELSEKGRKKIHATIVGLDGALNYGTQTS